MHTFSQSPSPPTSAEGNKGGTPGAPPPSASSKKALAVRSVVAVRRALACVVVGRRPVGARRRRVVRRAALRPHSLPPPLLRSPRKYPPPVLTEAYRRGVWMRCCSRCPSRAAPRPKVSRVKLHLLARPHPLAAWLSSSMEAVGTASAVETPVVRLAAATLGAATLGAATLLAATLAARLPVAMLPVAMLPVVMLPVERLFAEGRPLGANPRVPMLRSISLPSRDHQSHSSSEWISACHPLKSPPWQARTSEGAP